MPGGTPCFGRSVARPTRVYAATSLPCFSREDPKGSRLTDSGVHYLAFTHPAGPGGSGSAALHVADGSQILSRRVGGRSLTIGVGRGGRERYGSCLSRLAPPRLADGYLPILETRYVDAAGARYEQESFAVRPSEGAPLTSFVRVAADGTHARGDTGIRLMPGDSTFVVPAQASTTIFVSWSHLPSEERPSQIDRATLRSRPREGRRVLGRTVVAGSDHRRSRATGPRRRTQPAPPEPRPRLALQHRQPVPAVLIPGGARRRAGHVRVRLHGRRRRCPAPVALDAARALPALAVGAEAGRDRCVFPRLRRSRGHRGHDPGAASWRRGPRTGARSRRPRHSPARALLVRHPRSRATDFMRRPSSGKACARWAASGSTPGSGRSQTGVDDSPPGSRPAFVEPSASARRLADGTLFVPVRLLDDERPTAR